MSDTIPTVMTADGLQPQSPASLNAQLIAIATGLAPGLTANLPGGLIEDVSGTDTAALVVIDQARVDLVNSLTPRGANAFLLLQLGQIYLGPGSAPAAPTNTSALLVFSGPSGFVIAKGFTCSDGTYQYVVQDGGIIGSSGATLPLSAIAVLPGSWAVPPNTVTQLATSVPTTIGLTVTNPLAGLPGGAAQTEADYRVQVLRAGLASAQGMARFLKTLLSQVPGVQPRLVSVRQQTGGGWEIICGGGDQYYVAYAIYDALFDISTLTGSIMGVTSITQANPGVVQTDLNHGFATGQVIEINGAAGMTQVNGTAFTITVLTETTFSIGADTTGFGSYTGSGVVTPNFRNIVVDIDDYPDSYAVPYVNPPQQAVAMAVTWGTISPNFVSSAAIAQLAGPALATYVNSVPVGAPMNVFELIATFQQAVATALATPLLTRLVFAVSINGIGVTPEAGTGIIAGDPESYFFTTTAAITINQG